jgi:hypothetical protein
VYETYRMLGELREAELLREARRLRVGVTTRPRGTRRASLSNFAPAVLKSIVAGVVRRRAAITTTARKEPTG